MSCSSDSPLVVGVGGERELRVLNLQRNAAVCQHFGVTPLEQSVRARRRERSGETLKGPFTPSESGKHQRNISHSLGVNGPQVEIYFKCPKIKKTQTLRVVKRSLQSRSKSKNPCLKVL